MKKKYLCLLLAGMLCVSLTACARTPSQALVAQKNNERLEETAKATPQEGTELKDVAEATTSTYDLDYKSDDGKVTIKAEQAPVTLPEKDKIPMYHVYCGEIPQDVATKFYDYFLPEGGYTSTGTNFTKDKVDQSILKTKQDIQQYKDDDTLSDEEKQDMIKTQEEILASLEESRKDAPDESTLQQLPKDSTYVDQKWQTVNGEKICKGLSVTSKDEKKFLDITSSTDAVVTSSAVYEGGTMYSYSGLTGQSLDTVSAEDLADIGITEEDARKIVVDFIQKIGMPWEIHTVTAIAGWKDNQVNTSETEEEDTEIIQSDHPTAYSFYLTQTIDGIQSAITSSDEVSEDAAVASWLYESINVIVEKDGIVSFSWRYPISVEDTVSDNVGIISFDQAKDIFEQMMPLTARGDLEQFTDENMESTVDIKVTDVRMGLMRVRNSGNELKGLMTPVWLFYGDYTRNVEYTQAGKDAGYDTGDTSFTEAQPWILLAVNAVDGSVIDITEGY